MSKTMIAHLETSQQTAKKLNGFEMNYAVYIHNRYFKAKLNIR